MGAIRTIVEKAVKDEAFRKRLLQDANAAVAEVGITLPEGVRIKVHENSSQVVNVVLPAPLELSTERALSQAQLEQVAGGLAAREISKLPW